MLHILLLIVVSIISYFFGYYIVGMLGEKLLNLFKRKKRKKQKEQKKYWSLTLKEWAWLLIIAPISLVIVLTSNLKELIWRK